jgi:hypothetical protein
MLPLLLEAVDGLIYMVVGLLRIRIFDIFFSWCGGIVEVLKLRICLDFSVNCLVR